jgi:hypothetical protein
MGWMEVHKESGVSYKEYFQEGMSKGEIIDSCTKNGVFYGAVRIHETQEVVCLVVLIRVQRGYYNFSYKWMDESMHPYYYECPDRILDLLTPTENKYANEWRAICREKNKNAIRKGDWVKFEKPVKFMNGRVKRVFQYDKGNMFTFAGYKYRIHGWRMMKYKKIM